MYVCYFLITDGNSQPGFKDNIKFVRGVTEGDGKSEPQVNNPDEIDIDMDDDSDDEEREEIEEGKLTIREWREK